MRSQLRIPQRQKRMPHSQILQVLQHNATFPDRPVTMLDARNITLWTHFEQFRWTELRFVGREQLWHDLDVLIRDLLYLEGDPDALRKGAEGVGEEGDMR